MNTGFFTLTQHMYGNYPCMEQTIIRTPSDRAHKICTEYMKEIRTGWSLVVFAWLPVGDGQQ